MQHHRHGKQGGLLIKIRQGQERNAGGIQLINKTRKNMN